MSDESRYKDILRRDLAAFIQRSFRELKPADAYQHNWHIELLAAQLWAVLTGKTKRLIICLPPRYLKSLITSVIFPAFFLGNKPTAEVLCLSYGQDLTEGLARESLALMRSPFYRALFSTRLAADRQAVAEYKTTAGGTRRSVSLGGAITGHGADLIIIDDALKADDALSDARRKGVNESFDTTIHSRLNSKADGAIIIVTQRLHCDDLVAHVQKKEHWKVISIPAIAEEDEKYRIPTPYGIQVVTRKAGEPLHPDRESLASLEATRARNPYVFASQYQQNPQPPEGQIVKREWLRFYGDDERPHAFEQIVQSWDTAAKITADADFSVCTTWGLKDGLFYLLHVFRKKLEFPDLKRAVRGQAALWAATIVLIEDASSGTTLIQDLRHDGMSSVKAALRMDGDKGQRLLGQTPKFEGGFVRIPESAPWLDDYLIELTGFPNAPHDDQVDSTVMALAWLTGFSREPGILVYYKDLVKQVKEPKKSERFLVEVPEPPGVSLLLHKGPMITVPPDQIIDVDNVNAEFIARRGGKIIRKL